MVVVSDTSVLLDLERGSLLTAAFRLSCAFAVPDLLFERELKYRDGDGLRERGLKVETLDGDGVALALAYHRANRRLSLPDTFALALAKTSGWMLLTGDARLRQVAEREGVDCHGALWLLDRLLEEAVVSRKRLSTGLEAIIGHPRCRLPKAEVRARLATWSPK